jgi:hypothetical protein
MALVRFFDVVLVVIALPALLLAGLPTVGVLVGAGAWTLSRLGAAYVEHRAKQAANVRNAVGMNVAAMMLRAWFVAIAVLCAGLAASHEDGATAAAIVLAAFTVYLASAPMLRALEREPHTT